jgi:hypothetical protein
MMQPLNFTELEIRHQIWVELERAIQDRHHEWRTPVLVTVAKEGTPNARTVVLRDADAKLQSLQFFTDRRSPKIFELINQPAAMLVFWSMRLNWQLRVRVEMSVQTTGPQVDTVWERLSQSAAAGDYTSIVAPGDELPVGQVVPDDPKGMHHLAILVAKVLEIDWLEIRRNGHRRAVFGKDTWQWRVP